MPFANLDIGLLAEQFLKSNLKTLKSPVILGVLAVGHLWEGVVKTKSVIIMTLFFYFDGFPYHKFLHFFSYFVSFPFIKFCIFFQKYCNQELDIRSLDEKETLSMLRSEFPPLMDQLLDILALEKRSRFLPADVTAIVLKLIEIRRSIFTTAAERRYEDYM